MARVAAQGFSWRQFRVMLRVIMRGEQHLDSTGMGLGSDGESRKGLWGSLGAGARKVAMGLLFLLLAAMFSVNILYFVRDLGYYLTLPISATTIMWAKLAHFLGMSILSDLIILPVGLGCLLSAGAGPGAWVAMTLAFALCAVAVNLALVIICVPIMRFSRLAHDKDRFSRVFGGIIIVLGETGEKGGCCLFRTERAPCVQELFCGVYYRAEGDRRAQELQVFANEKIISAEPKLKINLAAGEKQEWSFRYIFKSTERE